MKQSVKITTAAQKSLSQGNVDEALKLFQGRPDPYTAHSLINYAYKEQHDISLAFKAYHILKSSAPAKLNSHVFGSLTQACQKLGEPNHIGTIWKEITHYR